MTIAQILANAACYMKKHGWSRGSLKAVDGTVCALGAIRFGLPPLLTAFDFLYAPITDTLRADDFLMSVVQREFPTAHSVPFWNDRLAPNADHVVHMLARASVLARRQGL